MEQNDTPESDLQLTLEALRQREEELKRRENALRELQQREQTLAEKEAALKELKDREDALRQQEAELKQKELAVRKKELVIVAESSKDNEQSSGVPSPSQSDVSQQLPISMVKRHTVTFQQLSPRQDTCVYTSFMMHTRAFIQMGRPPMFKEIKLTFFLIIYEFIHGKREEAMFYMRCMHAFLTSDHSPKHRMDSEEDMEDDNTDEDAFLSDQPSSGDDYEDQDDEAQQEAGVSDDLEANAIDESLSQDVKGSRPSAPMSIAQKRWRRAFLLFKKHLVLYFCLKWL